MSIYLIIINALGLLIMLIDKRKAIKKRYRIPEKVLFGIAAVGGSAGIYAGMYLFRHKTLHRRFAVGIPLLLLAQVLLLTYLYVKTSIRFS